MNIFKLFSNKNNKSDDEKPSTPSDIDALESDFQKRYNKASELIDKTVKMYYDSDSCACQHPRFIQIVGINCVDFGESFKAWETTLLVNKVKKHFIVETLENGPECSNEKWTCKKCESEFNYGWSDFSIAVEREVLITTNNKVIGKGKEITKPIPLYLGLDGHSFPSEKEIDHVDFEVFKKYIMEI